MQAEEETIEIGSRTIAYRLRRSRRRRRTMEISVDPAGRLLVAVPIRTPADEIDRFVRQKAEWIRKRLDEERNASERPPAPSFASGESIPLLGQQLLLHVIEAEHAARTSVRLAGRRLEVRVPTACREDERRDAIRRGLERWYRSRARAKFSERVRHFAPAVGVQPARVIVKAQKTRWGSCGKDGTLRLNWCLVMAPLPVIDYIVVHELCHLQRGGHGKAFWRLVARVLPDYRQRRAELRREGWRYRFLDEIAGSSPSNISQPFVVKWTDRLSAEGAKAYRWRGRSIQGRGGRDDAV